jgi:hypothetical protein
MAEDREVAFVVTLHLSDRGDAPTKAMVRNVLLDASMPWSGRAVDLLDVVVDDALEGEG